MLIGRQLKYLPQMLLSRRISPHRKDADWLMLNCTPPAEAHAIFERLVAESGTAARELSFGAVAIDARRVRCPVLSVSANEDRLVPPRIGRALVKKYLAEPLVVDGHAHLVIIEAGWENVAARVLDWLDRVVGKTARVKA